MAQETSALDKIKSTIDGATLKVYGAAVERDGVTVVPAVKVAAGGGGGSGDTDRDGPSGSGEGGGFGVRAKPAGAFIIGDGGVAWRPALDVNRLILGGQIVAIVALWVIRAVVRSRAHPHRHG